MMNEFAVPEQDGAGLDSLFRIALQAARAEDAVARATANDGLSLFVYPTRSGFLLGVGVDRDQHRRVDAESVLRRRSQAPERYGAWLPSLFADGSLYVIRRFEDSAGADQGGSIHEDLIHVRNLLS